MELKPQIETLNTLHKCAEIEEVLGKMYDFFAEAYQEQPKISKIFRKTAAEERNHEYQIRLAIKSFSPAIEMMTLASEDADKHLATVRVTFENLKNSPPSAEEALEFSIKMEAMSSHVHMDVAARFSDQTCTKLFTAMMSADEAHLATMEQTLKELRSTGTSC